MAGIQLRQQQCDQAEQSMQIVQKCTDKWAHDQHSYWKVVGFCRGCTSGIASRHAEVSITWASLSLRQPCLRYKPVHRLQQGVRVIRVCGKLRAVIIGWVLLYSCQPLNGGDCERPISNHIAARNQPSYLGCIHNKLAAMILSFQALGTEHAKLQTLTGTV